MLTSTMATRGTGGTSSTTRRSGIETIGIGGGSRPAASTTHRPGERGDVAEQEAEESPRMPTRKTISLTTSPSAASPQSTTLKKTTTTKSPSGTTGSSRGPRSTTAARMSCAPRPRRSRGSPATSTASERRRATSTTMTTPEARRARRSQLQPSSRRCVVAEETEGRSRPEAR